MRRPFPVISLSVGLVIALFAVLGPVRGQAPPAGTPRDNDPDKFPTVRVEPLGGDNIEGKLRLSAITLQTEIGSTTVAMDHVRRITFQKDPGSKPSDAVQVLDKSIVRGRVTVDSFIVDRKGGGEVTLKRTEIRQVIVLREVPLPWTAILFGLLTLSVMEIILGIDNVIFLAIVVGRLPPEQQPRARKIGLGAALGTRIALLFSLSFLLTLTEPIFTLPEMPYLHDLDSREVSWRDLILLGGGLFLIGKSVVEVHKKLEEAKTEHAAALAAHDGAPSPSPKAGTASFAWTIVTIAVIDIVFSLDSVITAIGMVEQVWVMVIAMVIAMAVMLYFAGPIGRFVDKHPTLKVLALSFLILIGVMLVAEGLGQHIDKGYIYAAMAFAVVVEMVNMQLRRPKKKPDQPALESRL
jgi:predicted tellurium resistance membrane protein TerC